MHRYVPLATEEKHDPADLRRLMSHLREFARKRVDLTDLGSLDSSRKKNLRTYLGLRGTRFTLEADKRTVASVTEFEPPRWFVAVAPGEWWTYEVLQQEDHVELRQVDPAEMPHARTLAAV